MHSVFKSELKNELNILAKEHNVKNGEVLFVDTLKYQDGKQMEYDSHFSTKPRNKYVWKDNLSKEIQDGR